MIDNPISVFQLQRRKRENILVQKMYISVYYKGLCTNYIIVDGGSLGTPKSDYLICARPLHNVDFDIFMEYLRY